MSDKTAQDNYADVYNGKLVPGRKSALLIIDVVLAYLEENSPLFMETAEAALHSNVRLAQAARKMGMPAIFTNLEYQAGGADGGLFYRKVPALKNFDAGSPRGAFPNGLKPRAGELVVTKQYASAFFGTPLAATLTAMGVDTLLITGYSTSGCVRATGVDAVQHGFVPLIVRDACADRHTAPHEANLFDLQAKYAEVISETEALDIIG